MCATKPTPLMRAAGLLDEAIELIINLKATDNLTPHRAAVFATLEANLRELQYLLHEELARDSPDHERAWRIIGAVLAAVVVRVLEALADIASCQLPQGCQYQLSGRYVLGREIGTLELLLGLERGMG